MNKKIVKLARKLIHDFKTDAMGDPSKAIIIFAVHLNDKDNTVLSACTGGNETILSLLVNGFVKVFDELIVTKSIDDPSGLKRELLKNLDRRLDEVISAHIVDDKNNKH